MPIVDGIGFGECTQIKIQHLSKIIGMHLAITQAVLNKYPDLYYPHYRYVDLTAGKGFTPDGIKGSPLVFLEQAESDKCQVSSQADFIECQAKNIQELEMAIEQHVSQLSTRKSTVTFYPSRYQDVIRKLFPTINAKELGLAFVDPTGDPPDFEALRYLASMRPKMEILAYLSSTNIKRLFQHTDKKLSDYIGLVGKRYWMIRNPISWDQFKWTFLLGSNSNLFKNYKAVDFFRLDTVRGKEILERLNLTEKERVELYQPKLL
jgi:three-Cys-motif partner protein